MRKGRKAMKADFARNAKGLLKPKITKYQKNQKVKETKGPTMTHKLRKNPEKPKMPKKRKKPGNLKKPKESKFLKLPEKTKNVIYSKKWKTP